VHLLAVHLLAVYLRSVHITVECVRHCLPPKFDAVGRLERLMGSTRYGQMGSTPGPARINDSPA